MSWTKNDRLRCDECGKLMKFNEPRYQWAPYGQCNDLEPPDDEHAHKKCYESLPTNRKELIKKISYIKPFAIFA